MSRLQEDAQIVLDSILENCDPKNQKGILKYLNGRITNELQCAKACPIAEDKDTFSRQAQVYSEAKSMYRKQTDEKNASLTVEVCKDSKDI